MTQECQYRSDGADVYSPQAASRIDHSSAVRLAAGAGVRRHRPSLETSLRPHGDNSTGPTAKDEAERALTRLVNDVYERRNPRTKATFGQLLDKWRHVIQIEVNTARGYRSKIKKHIRPPLGKIPVGAIDSEILESFYAELARCRHHCDGKQRIDHRTPGEHECGSRCRPHQCRGLADSTIRQIHWIISGALDRAVRWKWVGQNPADNADKPSAPHAKPDPPSVDEAARLVAEAAKRDLDWGAYVWCSMTLGAARRAVCSPLESC